MKPTMKQLLKEWRANLNEHVTDEEHEHPHGDESDEHHCDDETELNEAESFIYPGEGPMAGAKQPRNKDEAEFLLHDVLLIVQEFLSEEEIQKIVYST